LPLGDNYYYSMNPAFYHPHNPPNILELHPSALGTRFSESSLGSIADTNAVHSSEQEYLPNSNAQILHIQPSSHHLLGGISGDATSLVPSNGPKPELKDSSLTSFAPESSGWAPIVTPAFLDVSAILLPMISPHVREAIGPDGRRQWYCMFPECTRSAFLRRDRAEVHVASIHLNEKRIYCNGSCGKARW
jgi:hypothetical protein